MTSGSPSAFAPSWNTYLNIYEIIRGQGEGRKIPSCIAPSLACWFSGRQVHPQQQVYVLSPSLSVDVAASARPDAILHLHRTIPLYNHLWCKSCNPLHCAGSFSRLQLSPLLLFKPIEGKHHRSNLANWYHSCPDKSAGGTRR